MVKYYLTGKIKKKERIERKKGWFDKEIIEIPVYEAEKTNKWDTLYDERDSLEKILKERGINVDEKALEKVLIHTHAHI